MRAARALYVAEQRGPSGGFSLASFIGADKAEVWPENWPIWRVFANMQTQWRAGFQGPIGLDYAAAYPLLDRLHPRESDEWGDALDDLRAMEAEALDEMRSTQQ